MERRAFRMAMLAVKNEADALDIVQDSMMKLAHSYGHLQGGDGTDQWRPLFYTILQNCIMDFHRKQSRWRRWFVRQSDDEDEPDVQDKIMDLELNPEQHLQTQQMGKEVLDIIEGLPVQQQQCFLLRCWEELSVQETADIMKVSQSSVKTHYARAVQKIQQVIYEKT